MTHSDVLTAGYALLLGLEKQVGRVSGERLTNPDVTRQFRELHEWYLDELRPALHETAFSPSSLAALDKEFASVISCASGRARTTAGRKILGAVRSSLKDAAIYVASPATVASVTELSVISTLQSVLPAAAAGYEQALRDLAAPDRLSYRGVASELREVLREILDHYAPNDLLQTNGNGRRPTMKEKVRFILKSRNMGETRRSTAESAAEVLDDGVPNLARSIYDLGSLDTHVSPGRDDVARLRRYLEALLPDILAPAN